ncbi:hypothetical protein [Vibrio rotiferianus]|uniref:hypothetical protein n=1 Tax=Vibrio rotiferianus TaxID=190895 RepID=UPI00390BC0C7
MNVLAIIKEKNAHLARYSNENGAIGEELIINNFNELRNRPKGKQSKNLLQALKEKENIVIKWSSYDALHIPKEIEIDFNDVESIKKSLQFITFIEIKSASQKRVKEDFSGFFFSLTESEISASDQLGDRHQVILFNKRTEKILVTSVPEIINRTKSTNWQVSVQL